MHNNNKYAYYNNAFSTLQELKLQGIKIRNGAVLSRYSWAHCFTNDPCIFVQIIRWLYISVFERLTCSSSFNHEVAGLNLSQSALFSQ